jgi:lipoprotein NlpI
MKKIAWTAALLAVAVTPGVCASYDDLDAAISYFNQAQYDNAIVWFDKAIAAGDLIPDLQRLALLDRGTAYWAKSDIQKAITDYSGAIAVQPNDIQAHRQRISAYFTTKEYEKAWEDYETLRKLRPYDRKIATEYGWLSWQLNKPEASAEAFSQISKVDFGAWIWLQLANARLGRPVSDPSPLNEQSTRIWPGNLARFFQGELSDAEILAAAKANGENNLCSAYMYVGLWRSAHGDTASAETSLKTASEKCGNSFFGRIIGVELDRLAAETKVQ